MKKFLSLVLALVMALSLTTIAWGADTVTTKADLLAKFADNCDVKLGANIDVDDQELVVPAGKEAVLDLNGYKLSFSGGYKLRVVGTLTVKDTSVNGDGSIQGDPSAPTVQIGRLSDGYPGATLNLLSGSIVSNSTYGHAAIQGNGTAGANSNQNTTITISGGKVLAPLGGAIYHPQAGTLNISGGEITGEAAVAMKSGTLNITGGVFKATKDYNPAPTTNISGINLDGSVICIDSNGGYAGNMVINISNATMTSENGHIIREIGDGANNDITSVSVTSGTFTAAAGKEAINLQDTTPSATASVSGGTFNTDVSEYVAAGNDLLYTNGAYMVVPKTSSAGTTTVLKHTDKYDIYPITGTTSVKATKADITKKITGNAIAADGTVTYTATTYSDGANVYVEVDSSVADYKLMQGNTIVAYMVNLADVGSVPTTTKTVTNYIEAVEDPECGEYNKAAYANGVYVIDGKAYVVDGGNNWALYNGKFVNYGGVATAVPHTYVANTYSTSEKDVVTTVKCSTCKQVFNVLTKEQVKTMAPTAYVIDPTFGYIATGISVPAGTTPSTDKVTSAETFDAGIAMYVGMSVMAATGSAVVLKKRED